MNKAMKENNYVKEVEKDHTRKSCMSRITVQYGKLLRWLGLVDYLNIQSN